MVRPVDFLAVKTFWKSVKIWGRYRHKLCGTFFEP